MPFVEGGMGIVRKDRPRWRFEHGPNGKSRLPRTFPRTNGSLIYHTLSVDTEVINTEDTRDWLSQKWLSLLRGLPGRARPAAQVSLRVILLFSMLTETLQRQITAHAIWDDSPEGLPPWDNHVTATAVALASSWPTSLVAVPGRG